MNEAAPTTTLTPSQQAALAKIACGISRPGGVALLCGPQGVGKTTLLAHLEVAEQFRPRSIERRDIPEWETRVASGRGDLPDAVIADEAHLAADGGIACLLAACRARRPAASLVLAGEGRLLTLVSRDSRVEQAIHLRATLRPCTLDESCGLLAAVIGAKAADGGGHDGLVRTIHEIAAGIPAAMLRLADLASVLVASCADGAVTPSDIEAIHRRLSPLAA